MRIDSKLVNATEQEWTERFLTGKVPLKVALMKVKDQLKRMLKAGYSIKDVTEEINEWWQLTDKEPNEKVTETMIRSVLGIKRKKPKSQSQTAKTDETTDTATSNPTKEKRQDNVATPETVETQRNKTGKATDNRAPKRTDVTAANKDSNDAEKQSQTKAFDLSRVAVEWREAEKLVVISETTPVQAGTLIRVPSGGKAKVVSCKPIEYGSMLNKRSGLVISYEPIES